MNLAEKLKEKDRVESKFKWRTENEEEFAKILLAAGSEPAFVAKVTGLSLDKIKMLQQD